MRILDTDIQEIFSRMTAQELEKFYGDLAYEATEVGDINPQVNSEVIRTVLEKMGKFELASLVDDDKAISEIKDENEKAEVEMMRSPLFPGGKKSSVRAIPRMEIRNLMLRAKLMNKGEKYANQFREMSSQEIDKFLRNDPSVKNRLDGSEYNVDSKYGISTVEKRNVLETLRAQAYIREIVQEIPEKKLNEAQSKFEGLRNSPVMKYNNVSREMEDMLTVVFGIKNVDITMMSNSAMVDFAQAFEERQREIETKKQSGFLSRLKNLFKRKKSQKALPEGSENPEGSSPIASARKGFLASNELDSTKYGHKPGQHQETGPKSSPEHEAGGNNERS